jgi:hypothetical protein
VIDWDKPLRLRSTKAPVLVLARDLPGKLPYAIAAIGTDYNTKRVSHLLLLSDMGISQFGTSPEVENVPPEPVKVYVYQVKYDVKGSYFYTTQRRPFEKTDGFAFCKLIQTLEVQE